MTSEKRFFITALQRTGITMVNRHGKFWITKSFFENFPFRNAFSEGGKHTVAAFIPKANRKEVETAFSLSCTAFYFSYSIGGNICVILECMLPPKSLPKRFPDAPKTIENCLRNRRRLRIPRKLCSGFVNPTQNIRSLSQRLSASK